MNVALCLTLAHAVALPADVANMSGVWKLNVKKSKYDKDAAPLNVEIRIEHNEPALKYSGTVQRNQESSPDTFEFQGAIDEKIYPVKENHKPAGRSNSLVNRLASIESWSSDATMEEHAITTLSADGKTLTRKMHVKQKDGKTRDWTEVYDKQG